MTDLALHLDPLTGGDLLIADGGLATDDGLRTAIIISLFTDARSRPEDRPSLNGEDRRGWWGDAVPVRQGDALGSRFWVLAREKLTPEVALRARDIFTEALAWLIEDGIASAVSVDVSLLPVTQQRPSGALTIVVEVTRPAPAAQVGTIAFVWNAQSGSLEP